MIDMTIPQPATAPAQEAEPKPVNVLFANKLRDAAIITLLEEYGKFLMKKGIATDVEGVKTRVGEVCSPAIERGIITQAVIDHVFGNIEKHGGNLESIKAEKCCVKFLKHALIEEMAEVAGDVQEDPLFNEAMDLRNKLCEISDQLITKYGDIVKSHACAFFNEFKNLFDPAFAECTQNICK